MSRDPSQNACFYSRAVMEDSIQTTYDLFDD